MDFVPEDRNDLWTINGAHLIEIALSGGEDAMKEVRKHLQELCEALGGQAKFDKGFMAFLNTFSDPYLSDAIMDRMALTSLSALAFTNKQLYTIVSQYNRCKVTRIADVFGVKYATLIGTLKQCDAIIIGALGLKAVAPAIHPIYTNNMDIIVDTQALAVLIEALPVKHGYIESANSNPEHMGALSDTYAHHFFKKIGGRTVKMRIISVKGHGKLTVFEPMIKSPSTLTMNAITGHGLYSAYRRLISESMGIAIPTEPKSNGWPHNTAEAAARRETYDLAHQEKYMQRGFGFYTNNHLAHYPNVCFTRPECPLTTRILNDKGSVFMDLLSGEEVEKLTLDARGQWDIKVFRGKALLPATIWRLGDKSLEQQGFLRTAGDYGFD